MENMVPSLECIHIRIYTETNTYTHCLNLFSRQSIELPVDREQLATKRGGGGGYKPSTSPAGISFCKVAQLNFSRWQLLCSEDSHLGHNYLDFFFFMSELKNGTEDYSPFSHKQHCPLTSNCVYLAQLKWCKASVNHHCTQTGYLILALNTHFIRYLRHWSKLLCISAKLVQTPMYFGLSCVPNLI